MSVDAAALARLEFPSVAYEVSREKIAEYVAAIGDRNPVHSDPAAARALGYPDIIAPPTFLAVFATRPVRLAMADPAWVRQAGLDPARVVHGEQSFEFSRSIHPGDRVLVRCRVADVYEKGELGFVAVDIGIDLEGGELIAEGRMLLVVRPG